VKAFQAGCDGYVAKPFDPRTLLAAIRTHLASERMAAGAGGARCTPHPVSWSWMTSR
jgi:DNA-binding response OmpR family regulator